ncbi:hypothetical protein G6F31_020925 [Rhizopus arrhizus]|nr:hypothetical protein G6F31_020925 [Rhizopus arrhizus]
MRPMPEARARGTASTTAPAMISSVTTSPSSRGGTSSAMCSEISCIGAPYCPEQSLAAVPPWGSSSLVKPKGATSFLCSSEPMYLASSALKASAKALSSVRNA